MENRVSLHHDNGEAKKTQPLPNLTQPTSPVHTWQPQHNQPAIPTHPYQANTPYPPAVQQGVYAYPNTAYAYGQPYQTWQPQTPPQQKKWTTATMILVAIIALLFGAGMGVGIGVNLGNTPSEDIPDSYSQGSDPFFPEGTEGDSPSGATVNSAPGILIINSMLTGGLGSGTGMVISADGYAVTNYHVVEGSTSVQVSVSDTGENYTARVIGHDAAVDIALLKLEDARGLDYVEFDTTSPKKGESVSIVGNAGGQGYLSQLTGAITGVNQDITAMIEGEGSEKLSGLIKTDADVVQGYSGGPMYNSAGKVIGVVVAASSAGRSGDTDGYAIPAKEVTKIVQQIKTGKSKGTTIVGANAALGVTVTSQNEDGTPLKNPGANVVQVNRGSAAEKAGIQVGDTITAVNGKSVKSASDLSRLVKTFSIGDTVEVTYIDSSGKEKTAKATLGESPVN